MALQLCRRNKDFEMKSSGFGLCCKLFNNNVFTGREVRGYLIMLKQLKLKVLAGRGVIAPTHSRPQH
jgi:hypothetical protein